jgi:hypothetical protein
MDTEEIISQIDAEIIFQAKSPTLKTSDAGLLLFCGNTQHFR